MNRTYGYLYDARDDAILPNPSYPYPLTDSTLTEEKGNDNCEGQHPDH